MRKILSLFLVLLITVGCFKGADFNSYLKENIMIENGARINPEMLFNLDDSSFSDALRKSKLVIDYDKNKYKSDVNNNKIIAGNVVKVDYTYEGSNYTEDVDVNIIDNKDPMFVLDSNYNILYNKNCSEQYLINAMKIKVEDKSKTTIRIKDYNKKMCDYASSSSINVVVKDIANNSLTKATMINIIGEDKKYKFNTYSFDTFKKNTDYFLVVPGFYETFYHPRLKKNKTYQYGENKVNYFELFLNKENVKINIDIFEFLAVDYVTQKLVQQEKNARIYVNNAQQANNMNTVYLVYKNGLVIVVRSNEYEKDMLMELVSPIYKKSYFTVN